MTVIQLQANTATPVTRLIPELSRVVSRFCGGVDDMHLLGRKALVVCAEIYPHRLEPLLEALLDLSVEVRPATLPEAGALEQALEYRLTLQVVSQAGDTEGRVEVPRIPG